MARAAAFSLEFDSKDFERQCLQLAKGYGKLPKYLQNKHIKSAMKRFMTQKGGNLVKRFAGGLPNSNNSKSLYGRRKAKPGQLQRSVGIKTYIERRRRLGGPGWVVKIGPQTDRGSSKRQNKRAGWYALMVNGGTVERYTRPDKKLGTISQKVGRLFGLGGLQGRRLGAIKAQAFFPAILSSMKSMGKQPLEGYMLGALKNAEKELPKYLSKKKHWNTY